jgi:hypothetical protein
MLDRPPRAALCVSFQFGGRMRFAVFAVTRWTTIAFFASLLMVRA